MVNVSIREDEEEEDTPPSCSARAYLFRPDWVDVVLLLVAASLVVVVLVGSVVSSPPETAKIIASFTRL
ncbi:hypothetical protein PsorP6_017514 [Peronosclerospora sorghi]|uniref:Uncharacterized protein n=1 Tax=Peronosclerospora sorghi TaxID=230839 RepID=A0ACC0WNS3_9STRA|nr:hypothetical protein PsorP6_017514 [Peronosclerospora sorghi]